MFCTNCGTKNPEDNKFCIKCGEPLGTPSSEPAGGAAVPPTQPQDTQPETQESKRRWPFIILSAVLIFAVAAAIFFFLNSRTASGPELLLAFPNRDGEADLMILRVGQDEQDGQEVANNALSPNRSQLQAWAWFEDENDKIHRLEREFGGFLPNSDSLLIYYQDGDEVVVEEVEIGGEQSTETISTDALPIYMQYLPDSSRIFIRENREETIRCYVANQGEEADRTARGDDCWRLEGNDRVAVEDWDDRELTLTLMDLNGENEETILDGAEDIVSYRFSADTSWITYQQDLDDGQRIILLDRESGETLTESSEFVEIKQFGFIGDSNTIYYIAENDDGELEIHFSDKSEPVAVAYSFGLATNSDGSDVVFAAGDEDGEIGIFAFDKQEDVSHELLIGDDLQFTLLDEAGKVFIKEKDSDDLRLYTTNLDGSNLVEIFQEDDLNISSSYYLPDSGLLYFIFTDNDNDQYLYVSPVGSDEGYYLLEEWHNITLMNLSPDGRLLVFEGQEDSGDDPVLFIVDTSGEEREIEIDDDNEDYLNAIFAPDGDSIIYSARHGTDEDDVSVFQALISGEENPTELYNEAYIADARWAELWALNNLNRFFFTSPSLASSSPCPGARSLSAGDVVEGQIDADSHECYRLRAGGDEAYAFLLEAPQEQLFDFQLNIQDSEGFPIQIISEIGDGFSNYQFFPQKDGVYYLTVSGSGSAENPTYQLEIQALVIEFMEEPAGE